MSKYICLWENYACKQRIIMIIIHINYICRMHEQDAAKETKIWRKHTHKLNMYHVLMFFDSWDTAGSRKEECVLRLIIGRQCRCSSSLQLGYTDNLYHMKAYSEFVLQYPIICCCCYRCCWVGTISMLLLYTTLLFCFVFYEIFSQKWRLSNLIPPECLSTIVACRIYCRARDEFLPDLLYFIKCVQLLGCVCICSLYLFPSTSISSSLTLFVFCVCVCFFSNVFLPETTCMRAYVHFFIHFANHQFQLAFGAVMKQRESAVVVFPLPLICIEYIYAYVQQKLKYCLPFALWWFSFFFWSSVFVHNASIYGHLCLFFHKHTDAQTCMYVYVAFWNYYTSTGTRTQSMN